MKRECLCGLLPHYKVGRAWSKPIVNENQACLAASQAQVNGISYACIGLGRLFYACIALFCICTSYEIINPSRMETVRSPRAASFSLWVTTTNVCPSRLRNSTNKSKSESAFPESRLPVGSSASTTAGLFMRERAAATRCCSPPLSCAGK